MEVLLIVGGIAGVTIIGFIIWALQARNRYSDVDDEPNVGRSAGPAPAPKSGSFPQAPSAPKSFSEAFVMGDYDMLSRTQLLEDLRLPHAASAVDGNNTDLLVDLLNEPLPDGVVMVIADNASAEALESIWPTLKLEIARVNVGHALDMLGRAPQIDAWAFPTKFLSGEFAALSAEQMRSSLAHLDCLEVLEALPASTDTSALLPFLADDLDILLVNSILKGIGNADTIAGVMLTTTSDTVSHEAMARLESFETHVAETALMKVALAAPADSPTDAGFRAVHEIHTLSLLANVAEHAKDESVRSEAIDKVDDPEVLQRIAANDTDDEVRDAAAQRLVELDA